MTNQQNEEFAAKFGKLRGEIRAGQLGLPDEVWAAKDAPSSGCGGFDMDGVLCGPGPRVPGKAGWAALAAAFHDVVTEGEGIEPLGLWHEPKEREPKDKLAAASFHAMMARVRQGGGLPLTVLEECLSRLTSVPKGGGEVSVPAEGGHQQEPPREPDSAAGRLSVADLADWYGLTPKEAEALRKRLDRWRAKHFDGKWVETTDSDRRPHDPKYLYDPKAVQPIIDAIKKRRVETSV